MCAASEPRVAAPALAHCGGGPLSLALALALCFVFSVRAYFSGKQQQHAAASSKQLEASSMRVASEQQVAATVLAPAWRGGVLVLRSAGLDRASCGGCAVVVDSCFSVW